MSYQNKRVNSDRLEMMKKAVDFKGLSVLDIGCAEGYFCGEIKKLGADIMVGIGDSEIEEAKRQAEKENLNIEFASGDILKVQLDYISFDCVLFLSMLHYFHTKEEKERVLMKVSQLTKKYCFFEFEEGLGHPGHCSFGEFCEMVILPEIGFKSIEFLGLSDVGRKVLLCKK